MFARNRDIRTPSFDMRSRIVNRIVTNISRRFSGLTSDGSTAEIHTPQRVIYKSRFPDVDIPRITITEHVTKDFNKFWNKEAVIDAVTGRTLTFDQLKDAIWRVGSGMSRQGFGKGDVLLVISENSIDYIVVIHAALSLGGVISTCNNHYFVDDIAKQAIHSNSSYIYCSHASAVKVREVLTKVKNIKKVFMSGHEEEFFPISHLMEDDGQCFPESPVADPMSTALIPFSSGTTGLPKGVMISHYGEVANCLQMKLSNYLSEEDGNGIQLAMLPLYHLYGLFVHCFALPSRGLTTVIMPRFDPLLFLQCIQKHKIEMVHFVPPVLMFLATHELAKKFDLKYLRRIVCGAAPLGSETVQKFNDKFPHCVVSQAYGMTETGPLVSINQRESSKTKPGSCGVLVPNTTLKVIDNESVDISPRQTGEFCVKGPQMMMGYLNNEKATSDMVDKDGWLHTGDIGYMDEDGFLFMSDRAKELIKFKGLQVPPAELENVLCSHPCVADAAVIGVPDPEAGELPKAFVSLKQGASVSAEELQKFVNGKIVSYKRLRGGISFLPEIPRSPAGKILRRELRAGTKEN